MSEIPSDDRMVLVSAKQLARLLVAAQLGETDNAKEAAQVIQATAASPDPHPDIGTGPVSDEAVRAMPGRLRKFANMDNGRSIGYTAEEQCELDAADMLESLLAERNQLQADAERYRWLRDTRAYVSCGRWHMEVGNTNVSLDDAIDQGRTRKLMQESSELGARTARNGGTDA